MREVVFSKLSKIQLESILEYLELNFSKKSKEKFIVNFDKTILIIQKDPDTFRKSEINKDVRKCVISKQTTLYYKYNNKEIRLLLLFDTRQNPKKIKKIK